MFQWTGPFWEYMAKASLSYGGYFSCKLVSEHKRCRSVFSWEAFRAGPGTTNEQRLNCGWMCRVWLPQRAPPLPGLATAQEQGTPRAQISKEPQLLVHLCQPEDQSHRRRYQRVGSSSRRNKNQPHILYITLYVIVYNLLIPWWWCPCMEYLVFGLLKMAWNKKKCIIHRVTSVFATVVINPLCCSMVSFALFLFLTSFSHLSISSHMSMPRFSVDKIIILSNNILV